LLKANVNTSAQSLLAFRNILEKHNSQVFQLAWLLSEGKLTKQAKQGKQRIRVFA
jgi:hypothetical protein